MLAPTALRRENCSCAASARALKSFSLAMSPCFVASACFLVTVAMLCRPSE